MLRSRHVTERAESRSAPGEAETESLNARPWGAFSILSLVNTFKRLCSRLQAQHGTTMPVEPPAHKRSVPKAPSISNRRGDETDEVYFRSTRLFTANHYWYFATREGENKGPFKDRQQAELALAAFFAQCVSEETGKQVAPIHGGL